MKTKHKKQFENIYDILCHTEFKEEAQKEFYKFMLGKEVEWDGDNDIISIGKRFRFKLLK